MYIATLVTNPDEPRLDDTMLQQSQRELGGETPRWLAPGTAAEIALPTPPEAFEELWAAYQARGIDLAVQSAEGRRKRLLLADMDSTMIRQECIDELADAAGVGAAVSAVTRRAMNGEIEFEDALRERVAALRGLDAGLIARVLAERITLARGGRTLVTTMRANGAYTLLVSGGFTAFTDAVAARLGFDAHQANTLQIEQGRLTGAVAEPILGRQAKLEALERTAEWLGLTPQDAMAVGDGANDLAMLHRAGAGVALHAKPAVSAQCDLRINHGDLTALLYLQGYERDEFATFS